MLWLGGGGGLGTGFSAQRCHFCGTKAQAMPLPQLDLFLVYSVRVQSPHLLSQGGQYVLKDHDWKVPMAFHKGDSD